MTVNINNVLDLNTFHQLGDGDAESVGQGFEHWQAGIAFAVFHFGNVPTVDAEFVGHVALGHSGLLAQIADSFAKPGCRILR